MAIKEPYKISHAKKLRCKKVWPSKVASHLHAGEYIKTIWQNQGLISDLEYGQGNCILNTLILYVLETL